MAGKGVGKKADHSMAGKRVGRKADHSIAGKGVGRKAHRLAAAEKSDYGRLCRACSGHSADGS
jgi:hypothetical protein